MTRTYNLISSDGHLEIPAYDFAPYISETFRDRAPRLVKTPEGGDSWLIEGSPLQHTTSNLAAGRPVKRRSSHLNEDGTRFPGTGDGAQRLREQDEDGLDAEILFPPVFASIGLKGISELNAYHAIVEGYNRFLGEEYCAVAPDRLVATGVMPERGVEGAITELKRCASLGLKAVCLSTFPDGGQNPRPEDDRFWEATLELNMPIASHIAFGASYPPPVSGPQPGAPINGSTLTSRQASLRPIWTVAQMMLTGVFDRFPDLQFYFAETNASWLPIVLQQLDENYKLYEHLYETKLQKLPSEYIRDHVFFSFIQDEVATKMFDLLPVDNLMWGTDFPHSVTSFPNSKAWLDRVFKGIDPAIKRKITVETPTEILPPRYHGGVDGDAIFGGRERVVDRAMASCAPGMRRFFAAGRTACVPPQGLLLVSSLWSPAQNSAALGALGAVGDDDADVSQMFEPCPRRVVRGREHDHYSVELLGTKVIPELRARGHRVSVQARR